MLQVLVLHCPGNTIDPVSLIFPTDRSLFTSDTVLGQGTAVSEDLQGYTTRLQNVFDVRDTYDPLYPGHGPVVLDAPQTIRMYIDYRLEREAQILDLFHTNPPNSSWLTCVTTLKFYEGYPEGVLEAASRGI
jgi:glyoxylase-like metal-dependent hydrolase (beta-lactamase superfamily II)